MSRLLRVDDVFKWNMVALLIEYFTCFSLCRSSKMRDIEIDESNGQVRMSSVSYYCYYFCFDNVNFSLYVSLYLLALGTFCENE